MKLERIINYLQSKKQVISTSISKPSENVCFGVTFFVKKSFSLIQIIWAEEKEELTKRRSKEHVMWTCFKFWPMKNIFWKLEVNESLIMSCLQIYQETLLLATFLRAHSNSKEVSYLSWKNLFPNLKTICHIKLKLFFWTKFLENVLLAKHVISGVFPSTLL